MFEWEKSRSKPLLLSSHSFLYAYFLPVFVQAGLRQSAHSALYVVFPLASGKTPLWVSLLTSVELNCWNPQEIKYMTSVCSILTRLGLWLFRTINATSRLRRCMVTSPTKGRSKTVTLVDIVQPVVNRFVLLVVFSGCGLPETNQPSRSQRIVISRN